MTRLAPGSDGSQVHCWVRAVLGYRLSGCRGPPAVGPARRTCLVHLALLVLVVSVVFPIVLVPVVWYWWGALGATTAGAKAGGGMGRRSGMGLLVAMLTVGTTLAWAMPAQAARLMCLGRPATIIGTAGNDTLIGTPGADVIAGLGGEDTISGGDGAVRCVGGGAPHHPTAPPGASSLLRAKWGA